MKFEKGLEGCDDIYDLGWKHGTEDIGAYTLRPDIDLTTDEKHEYTLGYRDAQRGWY